MGNQHLSELECTTRVSGSNSISRKFSFIRGERFKGFKKVLSTWKQYIETGFWEGKSTFSSKIFTDVYSDKEPFHASEFIKASERIISDLRCYSLSFQII